MSLPPLIVDSMLYHVFLQSCEPSALDLQKLDTYVVNMCSRNMDIDRSCYACMCARTDAGEWRESQGVNDASAHREHFHGGVLRIRALGVSR